MKGSIAQGISFNYSGNKANTYTELEILNITKHLSCLYDIKQVLVSMGNDHVPSTLQTECQVELVAYNLICLHSLVSDRCLGYSVYCLL